MQIRNGLQTYRDYEKKFGYSFTWNDVMEAIDEYTGVKVSAERIRQFVEGKTKGSRNYPTPKEESLAAIVKFLQNEDISILSKDDFGNDMLLHQAFIKLNDYLRVPDDTTYAVSPERFNGQYESTLQETMGWVEKKITFQCDPSEHIYKVVETHYHYQSADLKMNIKTGEFSSPDEKDYATCEKYTGWAILTPEDNFLIFLKNTNSHENKYYLTMASDLVLPIEDPPQFFVLYDMEEPYFHGQMVKEQQKIAGEISTIMKDKFLIYNRKGDDHG